jgi:phosphatidylglycerophosphate synthase
VITRAYLVGDRDTRADQVIGGLPVLLRQVLSLQAAGIDDIVLVALPSSLLPDDPRIRASIREVPSLPEHDATPALVAPAGAVWNPALIRRLVQSHDGGSPADAEPFRHVVVRGAVDAGEVIIPQSAADIQAATTLLLQSLYKPTDGIASRYLHRRLSLPISRRLLPYNVTPNHMTALATLFGLAAVWVAYRGGYWNLLTGTLLFEVQAVLDGCDGELARMKYLHSRAGEWFDQVADDILNIAFLFAAGHALALSGHGWALRLAVVSVGFQIVYVIALYAGLLIKAGGRGSVATLRWWIEGTGPSTSGSRILGDLTRRDFISFWYLACAIVNAVPVAYVWHAVVTIVSGVVTAIGWIAYGGPQRAASVRS